jgi:transcriptional regulator with XRE-family HTH domain
MSKSTNRWNKLTDEINNTIEYKIESASIDIALQVYKQMQYLNINQSQLAYKLNVSKSYISQILKGKNNLTIETLIKLSEALNMKTEIKFSPIDDVVKKDSFILSDHLFDNIGISVPVGQSYILTAGIDSGIVSRSSKIISTVDENELIRCQQPIINNSIAAGQNSRNELLLAS